MMDANDDAVSTFVEGVASPTRRRDAETLLELMGWVTGESPRILETIDLGVLEAILTESYRAVTAGAFGQRARESEGGREQ